MKNTRLPHELAIAQQEIEGYARTYGLDFYPILYEVLDYRTLYETAALGGFPLRYPHWRFGMEYDQLIKGHVWLGSTIYEMVINTNPSYAYLLEGNEMVTQKMVMAHVSGHVDFFKNNLWFAHTNRKMLDEMANHATRIQRIIDKYGYDVVEGFIDTCLSLENLIDYHAPYIKRPEAQTKHSVLHEEDDITVTGLTVQHEYMRDYINPPEFLAEQQRQLDEERQQQKQFPEHPQKDILLFLLNYAPLERWQHTILEIVRNEAYYFAPQGMTKILNEGWACVAPGTRIATSQGLLRVDDVVRGALPVWVSDGDAPRQVYDWAELPVHNTVTIQTHHGFELEAADTHRVMLADGTWRCMQYLTIGDCVQLAAAHTVLSLQSNGTQDDVHAMRQQITLPEYIHELHDIPEMILHSPFAVMIAFVRALFDTYATLQPDGIVLHGMTGTLSQTVQLILLDAGVLATRCWQAEYGASAAKKTTVQRCSLHIGIADGAAARFAEHIGFGIAAIQESLLQLLAAKTVNITTCECNNKWHDTIVSVTYGRSPVFDLSVATTHRYVAQGFVNHNSFWHSRIMTQKALHASEIIQFADLHSGVVATSNGQLNPYKLGIELLRDVETRWNKGRFGKAYDECDDIAEKAHWDTQCGLGMQKLFDIRCFYNDVTFIDEFLTPEFVIRHKLFTFEYNHQTDMYEIMSRQFKQVKEKLLFQLTNFGQPFIYVENANHNNRGELYLRHRHEGVDLQMDYARDAMRAMYRLWTRPIYLETIVKDHKRLLIFDGKNILDRKVEL